MTVNSRVSRLKHRVTTAVITVAIGAVAGAQQLPTFRSSVDVTAIDVVVIDNAGRPITDLSASDFRVHVDRRERRVVTARWVPQTTAGRQVPTPEVIQGYSTNDGAIDGRLLLFAVDLPNLMFGALAGVRPALDGFINRLEPSDRVAAVSFGHGLSTPITTDRERVKAALAQMGGDMRSIEDITEYDIAVSEALEISNGNTKLLDTLYARNCSSLQANQLLYEQCQAYVKRDVFRVSNDADDTSRRTFQSLRGLLDTLKQISGPKTLVLVTQGFLLANQGPEEPVSLGELASAAQTTIHVLKVDEYDNDASRSRSSPARAEDRRIRRDGAELLTSVARGHVFDVLGAGDSALRQIEQEISGYYLLGVESVPTDRDGKTHKVDVSVNRSRATVRSRTALANTASRPRSKDEDLVLALSSPFANSGLPLRVTTFPFREGDGPNIQLLIHAEAGSGYSTTTPVSVGYVIADMRGNIVAKSTGSAMLPPAIPGSPSPLFFTQGVSLPAGDYTLKFAMTEGDRVGSVDHLIHATLPEAGAGRVSDLVVGGPVDENEPARPSIGYDVSFGRVQGYIEAYGRDVNNWTTTYEVSTNPEGPPMLSVGVSGRVTGDGRTVFSKTLPVNDLAPGKYFLRAALATNGKALTTVSRQFRISPVAPSVAATSAAIFALVPRSVSLPMSDALLLPPFVREQAFGNTLERFRRTVAPAARTPFDSGAAAFVRGEFAEAQQRFRAAVQPAFAGANNVAALAYLGAVSAASGKDEDAVSIWQTALTVGSAQPDVYEWLGQALMRLGRVPQARAAFADGAAKFPGDPRFHRSLAFVYAHLGQSRDALQAMAAYLAQRQSDLDMLRLGVEWVYRAHATGSAASDEERALVRRWVDMYEQGKGPNLEELKAWLRLIESDYNAPGVPASRI